MPNPAEVATLVVGKFQFEDWESVWVQQRWAESETLFRFTAAERDPIPELWTTLQFKPHDECAIYLGSWLAAAGVITTRQVAYDATNHGVMLMGKGLSWYAARGSVIDEKMNFDGMTFEQVARKVIAPFGVGVETVGILDATPFERLRAEPGITVWTFLEALARFNGTVLGSDHHGQILLIGKHDAKAEAVLEERKNILKAQVIIDKQTAYSDFIFWGQTAASDGQFGPKAAQQEGRVSGTAKRYSPLLQVAEHPVWHQSQIQKRAAYERQWNEMYEITATITVQGWHMPNGRLWKAGGEYHVKSPMAMLDQQLKAERVTFTQDRNTGTLTTLDLVIPAKLNGKSDFVSRDPRITIERPSIFAKFPENI